VAYHLAQVNIARLRAPLDAPESIDFVTALDPVNASADAAPGFVWRLQTEDGNATAVRAFEWDTADSAGVIVNLSVWRSIEELADWVYGDLHRAVLRRRREWFHRVSEATLALWWVPAGHVPTTDEAEERVRNLRMLGPTPFAFTFRQTFDSPGSDDPAAARPGPDDWLCPA
jgi:heme-degrading monooxygenase HmoA